MYCKSTEVVADEHEMKLFFPLEKKKKRTWPIRFLDVVRRLFAVGPASLFTN